MGERQFKGVVWVPERDADGAISVESALLHVLMDVRDELAELRKVLTPSRVENRGPADPLEEEVAAAEREMARSHDRYTAPALLGAVRAQRAANARAKNRVRAMEKAAKAEWRRAKYGKRAKKGGAR